MNEEKIQVSKEYKKAIERAIREGLPTIFDNHSLAHAEYLCERMFDETESDARIVTSMASWADSAKIRDHFSKMVDRLKSVGKSANDAVRVILVAGDKEKEPDLQWLRTLRDKSKGLLSVQIAEVENPDEIYHRMVCDERMVRLEKPHGRDVSCVNAKVTFNRPDVAKDIAGEFDDLWCGLKSSN